MSGTTSMRVPGEFPPRARVVKLRVKVGSRVSAGQVAVVCHSALLEDEGDADGDGEGEGRKEQWKVKATGAGTVLALEVKEGDLVAPGQRLAEVGSCTHPTVMRDMCAECGLSLAEGGPEDPDAASVAMVHSVPELKVSVKEAHILGKADEERLLRHHKLVLLVDLDQTLIHTTNDNIPPNLKDVYHFQLYGPSSPWYHTRLRPGTHDFLRKVSALYELHICSFGTRGYAHRIASFLDPDGRYFAQRILSRDECFNSTSKTANLKALFPCGDQLVCIIDDREDVWNFVPNLIHVKPYHFFKHTGDIHAPPGLGKMESDEKVGFDFAVLERKKRSAEKRRKKGEDENGRKKAEKAKVDVEKGNEGPAKNEEVDNGKPVENTAKQEVEKSEEKDANEGVDTETTKLVQEDNHEVGEDGGKQSDHNGGGNGIVEAGEAEANENEAEAKVNEAEAKVNEAEAKVNEAEANENEAEAKGNEAEVTDAESLGSGQDVEEPNKHEVSGDEVQVLETENKDVPKPEVASPEASKHDSLNQDAPEEIASEENNKPETISKDTPKGDTPKEDAARENAPKDLPEKEPQGKQPESKQSDVLEVEDPDDYLMYLEEILTTIHKAYYDLYSQTPSPVPDLKNVIQYVRRKVLQGVSIVFSGVVPTRFPLEKSHPYIIAKSLGVEVTEKLTPKRDNKKGTTHLVAARLGTAKVNDARRMKGVHVVTPDWLWTCAERWEHVDEKLFPLNRGTTANRTPPPHCSSPEMFVDGVLMRRHKNPVMRERSPSGRFIDTINPLMSFSSEDIADMDKEVEDIFNETDSNTSSEDGEVREDGGGAEDDEVFGGKVEVPPKRKFSIKQNDSDAESTTSRESLTGGECPKGWKAEDAGKRKRGESDEEEEEEEEEMPSAKFRRGEALPSDFEMGGDTTEGGFPGSDDDNQDEMDDGEWNMMGAALEREFLSGGDAD